MARFATIVVCVCLATVFTKLTRFKVAGWESLKPYTIGIIRGIAFAERHTKGMNAVAVKDYAALSPRISTVFEDARERRTRALARPRRRRAAGSGRKGFAVVRR